MGLGKDIGGKISSAVFALVMGIVIVYLLPVNFAAADSLNREFHPHCTFASETVRFVQLVGPTGDGAAGIPLVTRDKVYAVTQKSGGGCTVAAQATDLPATADTAHPYPKDQALNFRSDSGTDFTITNAATAAGQVKWGATDLTLGGQTGTWQVPGPVMARFQGINRLVTSILPVLITVGLITIVAFGSVKLWRGNNMGQSIGAEVGIVIVIVVVMNLAPSMFDAISVGAEANDGQYGVTSQFSTITDLIFGMLPLLVVLSLIGLLAWRGYSGYQQVRGGRGADAMMG